MSTVVTSYKDLNLFFVENDAEFAYLGTLGYSGNINDRQFNYLRALGHTGALPDMRLSFWSGPSYVINGFNPDIVFNYTTNYFRKAGVSVSHDDLLLHTATGGGTVTDSDGVLKHRAHNQFRYSEQVDNAAWTKERVTISADAITAPDGTATLDLITEKVSVTNKHRILSATTVVSGATYTQGCFAKTDGRDLIIVFSSTGFGATAKVAFDLTLGTKAVIAGSVIDSGITDVGDGIFWCWATKAATSTVSSTGYFTLYNGVTEDYIGDGVSGLYLWGMHRYRSDLGGMQDNPDNTTTGLESYVPTTTAAVYKRRNNYTFSGTYEGDGTELATNGTFDTDLTGWTADPISRFSWASGRAVAEDLDRVKRLISDDITVIAGRSYRAVWSQYLGGSSGAANHTKIGVWNGGENFQAGGKYINGEGAQSLDFVATVSGQFYIFNYEQGIEYDNISVQERIPVMVGPKCLVEPAAATNLFTYSEDFTAATGAWVATNTATLAVDAIGPDGETSATTLVDSGAGGAGSVYVLENATVAVSTTYTYSIYAKADQINGLFLYATGFTTPASDGYYFNLATGAITAFSVGTGIEPIMTDVGNGWYRCSLTFTTDATDTTGAFRVQLADVSGTPTAAVDLDGTSSILIYGAQFEAGSVPSSYIPTSGATATRALETLVIPAANLSSIVNTTAMSIHLKGLMSYADTGINKSGNGGYGEAVPVLWKASTSEYIDIFIATGSGAGGGRVGVQQEGGGVLSAIQSLPDSFSPSLNQTLNVATRHTSGALNLAFSGTLLTENATPTSLADLSAEDFSIAIAGFNGGSGIHNIQQGSLWGVDIGDAGIEEAST